MSSAFCPDCRDFFGVCWSKDFSVKQCPVLFAPRAEKEGRTGDKVNTVRHILC